MKEFFPHIKGARAPSSSNQTNTRQAGAGSVGSTTLSVPARVASVHRSAFSRPLDRVEGSSLVRFPGLHPRFLPSMSGSSNRCVVTAHAKVDSPRVHFLSSAEHATVLDILSFDHEPEGKFREDRLRKVIGKSDTQDILVSLSKGKFAAYKGVLHDIAKAGFGGDLLGEGGSAFELKMALILSHKSVAKPNSNYCFSLPEAQLIHDVGTSSEVSVSLLKAVPPKASEIVQSLIVDRHFIQYPTRDENDVLAMCFSYSKCPSAQSEKWFSEHLQSIIRKVTNPRQQDSTLCKAFYSDDLIDLRLDLIEMLQRRGEPLNDDAQRFIRNCTVPLLSPVTSDTRFSLALEVYRFFPGCVSDLMWASCFDRCDTLAEPTILRFVYEAQSHDKDDLVDNVARIVYEKSRLNNDSFLFALMDVTDKRLSPRAPDVLQESRRLLADNMMRHVNESIFVKNEDVSPPLPVAVEAFLSDLSGKQVERFVRRLMKTGYRDFLVDSMPALNDPEAQPRFDTEVLKEALKHQDDAAIQIFAPRMSSIRAVDLQARLLDQMELSFEHCNEASRCILVQNLTVSDMLLPRLEKVLENRVIRHSEDVLLAMAQSPTFHQGGLPNHIVYHAYLADQENALSPADDSDSLKRIMVEFDLSFVDPDDAKWSGLCVKDCTAMFGVFSYDLDSFHTLYDGFSLDVQAQYSHEDLFRAFDPSGLYLASIKGRQLITFKCNTVDSGTPDREFDARDVVVHTFDPHGIVKSQELGQIDQSSETFKALPTFLKVACEEDRQVAQDIKPFISAIKDTLRALLSAAVIGEDLHKFLEDTITKGIKSRFKCETPLGIDVTLRGLFLEDLSKELEKLGQEKLIAALMLIWTSLNQEARVQMIYILGFFSGPGGFGSVSETGRDGEPNKVFLDACQHFSELFIEDPFVNTSSVGETRTRFFEDASRVVATAELSTLEWLEYCVENGVSMLAVIQDFSDDLPFVSEAFVS